MDRAPSNKEELILAQRIQWLVLLRVLLAAVFLGLPLIFHLEMLKNSWAVRSFYVLIVSTALLSTAYWIFLKQRSPSLFFVSFQLGMDLLLEAALISVTGGLGSPFSFLFIITIVSAAIFFHQRGGLIMSAMATALFCGMALLQYWHAPPFETRTPLGGTEILYGLFLYMTAFFTVGIISGRLAMRLHEKEIGLQDLRIFSEDIAQSMPSGLITTDLLGHITSFNRSATEITGFRAEEVRGKCWWSFFHWDDVQNHYRDLAESGTPQRFEGRIATRQGKTCLLGVTISTLRNEQGEQVGVIGTFQDLTEIRNLEEAMQKKERLAMIGEMAAGMAHEIRNPLASLSGSIQVLRDELSLRGENFLLMEIAIKDTERLNAFVTQFLHYARPIPPQRRWVKLHVLLSEVVQLLKNDPAYSPGVAILLESHEADMLAFVDPDQMKQVFWNLGHNACQAMPQGGTLRLSMQRAQDKSGRKYLEVVFSDTGLGIASGDFSRIFDPFFTTKSTGSGLGLAIVQRVIEEHSGQIQVRSRPGKTTFRMRLPLLQRPDASLKASTDARAAGQREAAPLAPVES